MSHTISPSHWTPLPDTGSDAVRLARAEQALWTAVITQALMDAASASAKIDARKDKTRARDWLAAGSDPDFQDVCDMAGLDPSYVTHRAKHALARNCQWRLPAGEGWRSKARLARQESMGESA